MWWLPGIARRFDVSESDLRRALFDAAVALARLDIAASDPPLVAASLHDQLGIDFWAVADLAVAAVGAHVLRIVPTREMAVPAVVTLAAEIESPRTVELLGLRFDVERAHLPAAVPDRL